MEPRFCRNCHAEQPGIFNQKEITCPKCKHYDSTITRSQEEFIHELTQTYKIYPCNLRSKSNTTTYKECSCNII